MLSAVVFFLLANLARGDVAANCTTIAAGIKELPGGGVALQGVLTLANASALLDNSSTSYTLFAPSTDALLKLASQNDVSLTGTLDAATKAILTTILGVHVVVGSYPAAKLMDMQTLPTLVPNLSLMVMKSGDAVTVSIGTSSANVTRPDAVTGLCNGSVIHEIDNVLLPPAAPSNCTGIVTAVQCSNCTYGDLALDVALFPTLTTALNDPANPVTIFLPDNDAAKPLIDAYRANNITSADLVSILQIHVVPGVHLAASLSNGTVLTNLANSSLTIMMSSSGASVMGPAGDVAQILLTDVQGPDPKAVCGGSVVHVISAVLKVPSATPTVSPVKLKSSTRAAALTRLAAPALALAWVLAGLF